MLKLSLKMLVNESIYIIKNIYDDIAFVYHNIQHNPHKVDKYPLIMNK
jgi:hypothetical protein